MIGGEVIPFHKESLAECRARLREVEAGNGEFIEQDLLTPEAAESLEAMIVLLSRQHLQQKNMVDTMVARKIRGVTSLIQAWVKTCAALNDMEFLLEAHRAAVVAMSTKKRVKH